MPNHQVNGSNRTAEALGLVATDVLNRFLGVPKKTDVLFEF